MTRLRLAWKPRPMQPSGHAGRWTHIHTSAADNLDLPDAVKRPLPMLCGVYSPPLDTVDSYEVGDFGDLEECQNCARALRRAESSLCASGKKV